MIVKDKSDLLNYLIDQSEIRKDWFGYMQQRLTAIPLAHKIAENHADTMSPEEIVDFAIRLNNSIHSKIIKIT